MSTKLYTIEGVLRSIVDERYEEDTEKALKGNDYVLMPDSSIGCTKSYQRDGNSYAVFIKNGDVKYLVFINGKNSIETYVNFMRQVSPVSHIFEYFVKNAD